MARSALSTVNAGLLGRFGYIDPTDGGRVKLGTFSTYYSKSFANGDTLKVDGFLGRSLFDLYSNFTFFLDDPVQGDAFQQHDSRLQQGANVQYTHAHKVGSIAASFISGVIFTTTKSISACTPAKAARRPVSRRERTSMSQ